MLAALFSTFNVHFPMSGNPRMTQLFVTCEYINVFIIILNNDGDETTQLLHRGMTPFRF